MAHVEKYDLNHPSPDIPLATLTKGKRRLFV